MSCHAAGLGEGPALIDVTPEEWQGPSFGAKDSASERDTPAGCSVRREAANGLGARAWYRCRARDAREVCARMLGMLSAHPNIPRLPVLPQVSKMKPSALDQVNLHVEGGPACVLHEPWAWGAYGRRVAARKVRGASRLPQPPYGCGAVMIFYWYLSGIYHFFDSFEECGIRSGIGMVFFLIF